MNAIITSIRIEYISTTQNEPQKIEKIGGNHPDGTPWRLKAERAILAIENGEWDFHVIENGIQKKIIIAANNKKKYLTIDGFSDPKILLTLPACPAIP